MGDPNWREIYQKQRAERIEGWKKLRKELGQSASDKKIEKHVDKHMGEVMERVVRDRMHESKK